MDSSRLRKVHSEGTGFDFVYAISSMQGLRYEMEDAHCASSQINDLNGWSFFAVFDGHGGDFCSNRASGI
jgi:serine/threonine protein phosphatase PrpC